MTAGQRHGHTVSIDWPLWRDGGMRADSATVKVMQEHSGLEPLRTSRGIAAFYQVLRAGEDQVLVLDGDAERLLQRTRVREHRHVDVELAPRQASG